MQDNMNEAPRRMDGPRCMDASPRMDALNRMDASYNCGTNIDKFSAAMAYVPWQNFDKMCDDLEKAYCSGTIFPELNKPFNGRRCV